MYSKLFSLKFNRHLLFLGLSVILMLTQGAAFAQSNAIGMNIGGTNDYSEDRMFADVFRIARNWNKIGTNTAANVDAKGWPTEDAWLYVFDGLPHMGGTYKMRFEGQANITGATIQNKIYDAATNITTADVIVGSTTTNLTLNFRQTNGGVRNVKLMKPILPNSTESYAFDKLFTNEIKAVMGKVSCVRFLGVNVTNGDTLTVAWNDRVPDDYYWGSLSNVGYGWEGRGASWETMIKFCNEMNVDGWINVPVSANDDYVTQLATLWRNNLNPGRKLYIEYSNELWNTGSAFSQTFKNKKLADAEVASGNSSLNFDGDTNEWGLAWRRVAKRTVEISNIFRSIVGDANMNTRFRPVLMWQQPNGQGTAGGMLKWLDYYSDLNNKPINYYLYGGSGSAYYNPNNTDSNLSIDNIWTSATFDSSRWITNQITDANYAAAMGLKRIAYEGGPSMDRINTGPAETVKNQAWGDPRMKDLIIDHHKVWNNVGGDMLVYFQAAGDYQWGFTKDIYNLNTPKYQALDALNLAVKDEITIGKNLPINTVGGDFDLAEPSWKGKSTGNIRVSAKEWVGYLVNVKAAGSFEIKMDYAQASSTSFQFNVDGGANASTIQNINGAGTSTVYTVSLAKGLHFVRVRNKGTNNFEVVKFYMTAVADTQKPTIPTNLSASNISSSSITLNWTASTDNVGVTAYEVFRGGVSQGTVSTTSFTASNLTSGTSYSFTVRAQDAANNSSDQTAALNVSTTSTAYPIITARGENLPNEGKEKAFDGLNNSKWLDFSSVTWLQIRYENPVAYNQYVIVSGNDQQGRDPKNWTLLGSNDGTTWTTLDTQTDQAWAARNQANTYVFNNTQAYTHYKLDITANTNGGGVTQLSELTYSTVAVLPVELISFGAKATAQGNILNWRTASEQNNLGFEILRSNNGVDFEKIGFKHPLTANGNSSSSLEYSFYDRTGTTGVYYQLNQVDKDGKISKSKTAFVKGDFSAENQVYPNPVSDVLNIIININKADQGLIGIYDQNGRLILEKLERLNKGRNAIKLNIYDFPAGWYLLNVKDSAGNQLLYKKVQKF